MAKINFTKSKFHSHGSSSEEPQSNKQNYSCTPTEEETASFFEELKDIFPQSAILRLVEPCVPSQSSERVRHLSDPVTALFDVKNKQLSAFEMEKKCKTIFESMKITGEEAEYLEQSTKLQAQSNLWFEHRKGRLTASKFARISRARIDSSRSLLKSVMQYNPPVTSRVPALKWGVDHENVARQQYIDMMSHQHNTFECHPAGLMVCIEHSHLGASPDGLVTCVCCGSGLVEIKCPYKHREEHPHQVIDSSFCLSEVEGAMKLNHCHDYYIQVQGQMAVCSKEYCDFVCWTTKGIHIERVLYDADVFRRMKPSLDKFFLIVVLPEILTHKVHDEEEHQNTPASSTAAAWTTDTYCFCRGKNDSL